MKLGRQPSKQSLRDAIKAMCTQCMGGPEESGYRVEIARCSSIRCPLREYRPYQGLAQIQKVQP